MYGFTNNFYSSGDEVLEIDTNGVPYVIESAWDFVSPLIGFDADVRRNTWQKQEFYKGRSWVYGTGWAGWGFESNVTATAVNAAAPATLRDAPIFEHDPEEMFSATITTNMQNSILAKGIPALSSATGVKRLNHVLDVHREIDMNVNSSRRDDMSWCRNSTLYGKRWLHSDIQNTSFFFTHKIFRIFADNIMEDAE